MLNSQAVNRAGWFQPLGSGGSDGWVRRQANRLNTRALAVLDKVGLGSESILVFIIILCMTANRRIANYFSSEDLTFIWIPRELIFGS